MLEEFQLRHVNKNDIEDVFSLSNEDYVRKYSINKSKILWKDHVLWFNNITKSKLDGFYIVTNKQNDFLGQIRYKFKDDYIVIISISFSKLIKGLGISHKILMESMKILKDENKKVKTIVAFVSTENIASKKMFEKSNYILINQYDNIVEYNYNYKKGAN